MKILIVDDEPVSLHLLGAVLKKQGHEVVEATDGEAAWELIQAGGLRMAIVDWMMPRLNGTDLCRRVRAANLPKYLYMILLTSRSEKADIYDGLDAGADDFIVKPLDPRELQVRLKVGLRMLDLEDRLAQRIDELQEALDKIQTLEGLLPICAYCNKVRGDEDYWQKVETYMQDRTNMRFSHGVCPDCFEKYIKPELEGLDAPPLPGEDGYAASSSGHGVEVSEPCHRAGDAPGDGSSADGPADDQASSASEAEDSPDR